MADPSHPLAETPATVPPISALKDRLVRMFLRVPELLSAGSIEEKLRHAAVALTGPGFFDYCAIYLDDVELGVVAARAGKDEFSPSSAPARSKELRTLLEASASSRVVDTPNLSERTNGRTLVLPMRDSNGQLIAVAEFGVLDESLLTPEMLTLVEVFLTETTEAIQRFRLEGELEKSEATYRSLIDNVSDVIFQLDLNGNSTFVSRQVFDLLGISWQEALGTNAFSFVAERDRSRVREAFDDVVSGRTMAMDVTLVRPEGPEVVAFVSARPMTEGGTVTGIMGIARDVTEKRRLEEQVRESERRYRALTENAYDAIFLVDPESCAIVDANPQAEELTGYSRSDLLRMSVFDLRRAEFRHEVRRRIDMVMSAGVGRFEDAPLVRRDGSEVHVDAAASVYEVEGKRYYQAILRDVSAQKVVTETLNRRVMELQILAEVSDALQSSVDLQSVMAIVLSGVTAGKGLGFNRAFILSYDKANNELRGEAGLGPSSAEEAGRIWSELERKAMSLTEILQEEIRSFGQDSSATSDFARRTVIPLDEERNVFVRAILNREAIRVNRAVEDPHLPEDFLRQYPSQEFAIVPLVTRDDVMGVLLVDNLFTWRPIADEDLHRLRLFANSAASAIERSRLLTSLERRLHELTLANQDLKASRDRLIKTERLSAIGEVAASVAHEIRNPLTAIGGFARSVFSALDDSDKNKRRMQIIIEEADRLEHILSSLLEFTRPAVPRFTDLDVNALILQTVHFMDTELKGGHVHVEFDLDPNLPHAWADGQQIRQVFLNVIRNALQELKSGGLVKMSTREDGSEVRIAVTDNGPGIPPEHLEKVFDAFFTTKPAGSGLGLAICSQIVRNHNGRVEAFSQPGEGATFVIRLPAAPRALDSY